MRGSCLCGGVAFGVRDAPRKIYQCHCSLCRKQSGSAANAAFIVMHDQLTWMSGEALIATYARPTGFRSNFCSRCGSPLPNPIGTTQYTWIPVGLFDTTDELSIAMHLNVGSKATWEPAPVVGTLHREMPSLEEIVDALSEDAAD